MHECMHVNETIFRKCYINTSFLVPFRINSNWEKVCVHTKETECDVTDKLEKVKDTYTAHIVSEMISGTEKFEEPSYAISPKFTPYNQSK